MSRFRLFNVETLLVEEFELDDHPAYVAASHAWIDKTFIDRKDEFGSSFGGSGIKAVFEKSYPDVKYCWVDRLCINQQSKQDKLMQIPLMERIFGQAEAVVIFINNHLGVDQKELDVVAGNLAGALAMCKAESWQDDGEFWQYGEGRPRIVSAMHGLQRLASTIWATRVWTLQEYVLAKLVIWIGLDLKPVQFDQYILYALPDICDTLAIEECLIPEMQVIFSHLQGMANFRLQNIERTRVMELTGDRSTKKSADMVYGAMAASGVSIEPLIDENEFDAWRRWCQAALMQGRVRWALLPANVISPHELEERSCILPYFSNRHKLSLSSGLDDVKALHPVAISDGCVKLAGRRVGMAKIVQRLGKVHEPQSGRVHRDITLVLFSEAKWRLALKVASAFGGGRYDARAIKAIARVFIKSYLPAMAHIINGTENEFRPCLSNEFQRYVWSDFMEFQQSQMIGLNEGVGYLCEIDFASTISSITTVLVGGERISALNLEALDFEAHSADGRSILMVVNWGQKNPDVAHKIGMTLPISDDVALQWSQLPIGSFQIGGKYCDECNRIEAADDPRISDIHTPPLASDAWEQRWLDALNIVKKQLTNVVQEYKKPSTLLRNSTKSRFSAQQKRLRRFKPLHRSLRKS